MKNNFRISHNRDENIIPTPFHSHDFYEIYFFAGGNVTYYIENENYDLKKGDVLIIPPGKLHRPVIENNAAYDRYVLWLYGDFVNSQKGLGELLKKIEELIACKNTKRISFSGEELRNLTVIFNKLINNFNRSENESLYVCESSIALIVNDISEALNTAETYYAHGRELISQVISYINDNVSNAPSLEKLSEKFYVSKYYLSHKFKEYAKTSVHKYILMKKINLAKQLLVQGKQPIEVCEVCGFSTYSNFYKEFKNQTGISPKKFFNDSNKKIRRQL